MARVQALTVSWRETLAAFMVPLFAVVGGSLVLGRLTLEPQSLRYALLIALALLVIALGFALPKGTLYALVIWLAALGFTRRVISSYSPTGGADPLLLVGPTVFVVLLVLASGRGAFRQRTALSNAVVVLSGLAVIGALNPLQGSVITGLAGLLFFLVPMLAFWIGRGLCDDATFRRVLIIVASAGFVAALYGLAQTFRGFPSWDAAWIAQAERQGYEALFVHAVGGDSTIRPFATLSSASEYVSFLAVALIIVLGLGLRRGCLLGSSAIGALLAIALFYGSSRGVVVSSLAGLTVMAGIWRRQRLSVTLLGAAALLVLMVAVLRIVAPVASGSEGAATLVAHQTQGLSDPFNSDSSTAGTHVSLLIRGVQEALTEPLGVGTGSVSIAAVRFGGRIRNTEADPSNVAVALGIPGLLAYAVLLGLAFRCAYRQAVERHDRLSLVVMGVLFVTLFQWLAGGNYAVAFIPWLALGWLDRPRELVSANENLEA